MSLIYSFPPIAHSTARVLILGTMPGRVSLRERQYYAHPQNAFWRIIGGILGFDPAIAYPERVAAVQSAGIAVWDVLKACVREGSLDSAIDPASMVSNDFAAFFAEHPQIRQICFNGATAQALYMKYVRPRLGNDLDLEYRRLPSTSPANASLLFAEKSRAWQAVVRGARAGPQETPAARSGDYLGDAGGSLIETVRHSLSDARQSLFDKEENRE